MSEFMMVPTNIEIDDDYDEILRLQNSVEEVSSMMKEMTANNFKQANRNFAVDITVEETHAIDKTADVYKFEAKQTIIDKKRMWQALESVSKVATNYADRLLAVEVGNTWGRLEKRVFQESKKEQALQGALREWQTWLCTSRYEFLWTETPACYKCYVCSMGWWRLYPFKEHIGTHEEELQISLETTSVECNMIAFIGDNKPEQKAVPIDGHCLKCSKGIEEHGKHQCDVCLTIFAYCSLLYRHDCLAIRHNREDFVGPEISDVCAICGYKCKVSDMDSHRLLQHTVPSDEPVNFIAKRHSVCGIKYVRANLHACPFEMRQVNCNYCPRKFDNVLLSKLHMDIADSDVTCQICSELLPRQCMLMEHLSAHSEHFAMVAKCAICAVPVVFPDEVSAKYHMKAWHDKIETRNKTYHDMVIIPKMIVQKWRSIDLMDKAAIYKQEDAETNNDETNIINAANLDDNKNTNISTNSKNVGISNSTHNDITDECSELVIDEPDDDDLILISNGACQKDNVIEIIDISDSDDDTHNINHERDSNDGVELVQQISEDCDVHESSAYVKKSRKSVEVTSENLKITNEDSQTQTEIDVVGVDKKKIVGNETGARVDLSLIKQEVDDAFQLQIDEEHYYVDDLEIKNEADVCNEVLSHIFEASKLKNHFEADDDTNFGVIIKTETVEEPKLDLKQKMKSKLSRRIYRCLKCRFQGYHREYAKHREERHPKRRKQYLRENAAALQKVEINMHELASEDMYNCTKCSRKFDSFHGYVNHFVLHDINLNTCPLCETTYMSVVTLCNHIQKYHIEKSFVALRVINREGSWPEPDDPAQKQNTKLFQCLECETRVLRSQFFIHWENHFGFKVSKQELDMMSLDVAIEDRKVENALSAEVLRKFKGALMSKMDAAQCKSYNKAKRGIRRNCVYCSKDFERVSDCKRHLIEHLLADAYATHGLYEAFRCQFCGEKFGKVVGYKQHMRDHGNLPVYQCELCNKTFSDSSNFAKHKKIHNLKVYVCDLCGRKFQAKISLEKHLQNHDKPVVCKLCRKRFPTNTQYRRHMNNSHPKYDLLKFICPMCRKRFESTKLKLDHMWLVHKARKTQQDCTKCGLRFRRKIDLKSHLRQNHFMSTTDIQRALRPKKEKKS